MDKKQKEALVLALLEKGETYRSIARQAGVSPNTIKAIANKAGLDECTSLSSRAFELYIQQKTPVEVAIALNLEADKAIQYYHDYFKLLGITEFTRVYLQVKDDPNQFVNLFKLTQNSGMGNTEVAELLKIANGHLPRVRLEYNRLQEEINYTKAELNSWKAVVNNEVRVYQDFCDRNLKLKNREDELQQTINELEAKKAELQRPKLNEPLLEFHELNGNKDINFEVRQEEVPSINEVTIPQLNVSINHNQNENETSHYHSQVELSSRTLVFDTKDLF
jgi:predicted transcriptional regulator